ncbi:hypothetical protein EVAR_20166_1 [Eumeta japonica]|uniref:Uncharacterized protein n=1 Tax=Eumeta variegata TaxID=151549 RepID=A0A4C1UUZ0_EUMVA|nr:hypothetical protein EVAR_20166_1 [Eumeta japonica]
MRLETVYEHHHRCDDSDDRNGSLNVLPETRREGLTLKDCERLVPKMGTEYLYYRSPGSHPVACVLEKYYEKINQLLGSYLTRRDEGLQQYFTDRDSGIHCTNP